MSDNVVGTVNLAERKIVVGFIDLGNGFGYIKAADGTIMGIDPNGNIYWKATTPGAYETGKKDGHLVYFKFGVVSYDEGYLT